MDKSFRTTINVHCTSQEVIDNILLRTDYSEGQIVSLALNMLVREYRGKKPVHYEQVKYQEDDPGNYEAKAVTVTGVSYEYLLDLRHVSRKTVSLLIAIAVRKYYELFVSGEIESVQNFVRFHFSRAVFINGLKTWIQHWGKIEEPFVELYNYSFDSS